MIVLSIDLNKIDKSKIKAGKNGEKYYSIVVDQRREADKFGNTHTVYDNQSKEDREAKVNKNYIGSGKEYNFNGNKPTTQNTQNTPVQLSDTQKQEVAEEFSLPF